MSAAPRDSPCHVIMFQFRAPALPAQRLLGGGFGRGAKPPSEWNVQRVRLACGRRAPPCGWTLLIALARALLQQAPRAVERERSPDPLRRARRRPAPAPDHGVLGLERCRGVRHHRCPLSGPALAFAALREHRSRGVLPLRALASLRALQGRFAARAQVIWPATE